MCGGGGEIWGLPVLLEWANQLTPAGLNAAANEDPGGWEGGPALSRAWPSSRALILQGTEPRSQPPRQTQIPTGPD